MTGRAQLFHMTNAANLKSIWTAGELRSRNLMEMAGLTVNEIAYDQVLDLRRGTTVPLGGNLLDYVPFYFNPRSPMLYALMKGRVPTFQNGQRELIQLHTDTQRIVDLGLPYTFTNRHAVLVTAEFTTDVNRLKAHIDWGAINAQYFRSDTDPDLKSRRQAEFLVRDRVPIAAITSIGVFDEAMQTQVTECIEGAVEVTVKRDWYF
ncbi:MAG: DUF4433 domain-containing protein [Candidatus Obscuribacterales bacterium]|nr:DUF4433 domain-containing protein [Candidatus Obscuribacterales bacterium]